MTLLKITSQLQDLCFLYICVCPSLCLRLEARAASHAPEHPWPGARVLPFGRGGGSCEATGRRHIRCAPQSPARPREPAAGELEARLTLGNLPRPPCVGINRDTFQPDTDNMATWLQTSSTDFKICNHERNHDVHDGVNTFDPMHMITEFSLKAGSPKKIAMVFRAVSTQPLLKADLFSCWLLICHWCMSPMDIRCMSQENHCSSPKWSYLWSFYIFTENLSTDSLNFESTSPFDAKAIWQLMDWIWKQQQSFPCSLVILSGSPFIYQIYQIYQIYHIYQKYQIYQIYRCIWYTRYTS